MRFSHWRQTVETWGSDVHSSEGERRRHRIINVAIVSSSLLLAAFALIFGALGIWQLVVSHALCSTVFAAALYLIKGRYTNQGRLLANVALCVTVAYTYTLLKSSAHFDLVFVCLSVTTMLMFSWERRAYIFAGVGAPILSYVVCQLGLTDGEPVVHVSAVEARWLELVTNAAVTSILIFVVMSYLRTMRDQQSLMDAINEALTSTNQRLRESTQHLRMAQNIARMGSWEFDLAKQDLHCSRELLRIFGIESRTEANLHRAMSDLVITSRIHPSDKQDLCKRVADAMSEGTSFMHEFRAVLPSGDERTLETHGRPVFDADDKLIKVIGVTQDVTERRRTEAKLREQEIQLAHKSRMEGLGEMAGGLAHEMNNPLAIIQARSVQLTRMLEQPPELDRAKCVKITENITQTCDRMAKIIAGLKAFARDGARDPVHEVELLPLLNEAIEYARVRNSAREVEMDVGAVDPQLTLRCRAVQLIQVIMNLVNNACDATESLDERWVRIEARSLGSTVEVRVTDSGKGIPAETSAKIFEPFYTTKEVGRGMGLGLSISKGIIESQSGWLYLDGASPNTCFVIVLPAGARAAKLHSAA